MQRRLFWTALEVVLGGLLVSFDLGFWFNAAAAVVFVVALVSTWNGLPDWVARYQELEGPTGLGSLRQGDSGDLHRLNLVRPSLVVNRPSDEIDASPRETEVASTPFGLETRSTASKIPPSKDAPSSERARLRRLDWSAGNPSDARPEYRNWVCALFQFEGPRAEPAKAFVDFKDGRQFEAHFSGSTWHEHEVHQLDPYSQFAIWVFLQVFEPVNLFIDTNRQRFVDKWTETLPPGAYWTDSAFMDGTYRQPLTAGEYQARARVVVGKGTDVQEWTTDWRDFTVDDVASSTNAAHLAQSASSPYATPDKRRVWSRERDWSRLRQPSSIRRRTSSRPEKLQAGTVFLNLLSRLRMPT